MSLATVYSRASHGIHAPLVTVEVHLINGIPQFSLVGLPAAVVKESKDRVRSALISNHFTFPLKRIIVNLAPADLPKEGGRFDLPIALGILLASKQLQASHIHHYEFAGELSLTGDLKALHGALPFAHATSKTKRQLILPKANQNEAALLQGNFYAAEHLMAVCEHLSDTNTLPKIPTTAPPQPPQSDLDLADIKGQSAAVNALMIAASGQHNLLLSGPPGTGKTMLAQRLPSIMPKLTRQQIIDIAMINSLKATLHHTTPSAPPFRHPHHSASPVAIIGGGNPPKPGEISLAHHGILFFDELPEFGRSVLEALREPLESGTISIARSGHQVDYPARFLFIATMNPCPCGYAGDPEQHCRCTPTQIDRYQKKLSGPLLDRIDLHTEVHRLSYTSLNKTPPTINSNDARACITKATARQYQRQQKYNAHLSAKEIQQHCQLTTKDQHFFMQACEQLHLSLRSHGKLLKVARTIADLNNTEHIARPHLEQALTFRRKIAQMP